MDTDLFCFNKSLEADLQPLKKFLRHVYEYYLYDSLGS